MAVALVRAAALIAAVLSQPSAASGVVLDSTLALQTSLSSSEEALGRFVDEGLLEEGSVQGFRNALQVALRALLSPELQSALEAQSGEKADSEGAAAEAVLKVLRDVKAARLSAGTGQEREDPNGDEAEEYSLEEKLLKKRRRLRFGKMADVLKVAVDLWKRMPDPDDEASVQAAATTVMSVTGACEFQRGQVDGIWTRRGITASGRSWFSNGRGKSIYWDPNCDGQGFAGAWIIDIGPYENKAPDIKASFDLDADGACVVDAWKYSENLAPPLGNGTWRMFCGQEQGWQTVGLQLVQVAHHSTET